MISKPIIQINQPIGTFYITKLSAKELIRCTTIKRRESGLGVQRPLNIKKVRNVELYCEDPDATFPTPIIIAAESKKVELYEDNIKFNEDEIIGEIIDGQHRVEGLRYSNEIDKFELPVIIMLDLDISEKAYIFSIINSNQTTVPKSLIYDLFDLDDKRNVYKVAHDIARALNSDIESAFYRKLKMLGKKENSESSLSQGTFVTYLIKLYSKNPDEDNILLKKGRKLEPDNKLVLRNYFINNKDEVMYKILRNYFNSVKYVFYDEWNNPEKYILSKSTGYGGLIKIFPYIFKIGIRRKTLNEVFFKEIFNTIKDTFNKENIELTSDQFPSNEVGQKQLASKMEECLELHFMI